MYARAAGLSETGTVPRGDISQRGVSGKEGILYSQRAGTDAGADGAGGGGCQKSNGTDIVTERTLTILYLYRESVVGSR